MSDLRSFIFILLAAMCGTMVGEPALQMELRITPTAVLGDAVPVRVLFANAGDEATYLRFSGVDYGTEALTVCAYKEGRWYRTGQIHIDREVGSDRFDFVPLRPEHKFEAPLLAINDPMMGALEGLLLPETGTYEVFVAFTSDGPRSVGVLWPVWRGVAASSSHSLTITEPSAATLSERRAALQVCAAVEQGCAAEVIAYFRTVRDARAAAILTEMLDRIRIPNPDLAEAVANQLGDGPQAALGRFAARFPSYTAFVKQILSTDDAAASFCQQFRRRSE